jgi:hypothetical protein
MELYLPVIFVLQQEKITKPCLENLQKEKWGLPTFHEMYGTDTSVAYTRRGINGYSIKTNSYAQLFCANAATRFVAFKL